MKREELKKYLHMYSEIKEDIKLKKKNSFITKNKIKFFIPIHEWVLDLPVCIKKIIDEEKDVVVRKVIHMWVIQGIKDKTILSELPISESTFYRWKNKIIWKVYMLFVINGYVTEEEILDMQIE